MFGGKRYSSHISRRFYGTPAKIPNIAPFPLTSSLFRRALRSLRIPLRRQQNPTLKSGIFHSMSRREPYPRLMYRSTAQVGAKSHRRKCGNSERSRREWFSVRLFVSEKDPCSCEQGSGGQTPSFVFRENPFFLRACAASPKSDRRECAASFEWLCP